MIRRAELGNQADPAKPSPLPCITSGVKHHKSPEEFRINELLLPMCAEEYGCPKGHSHSPG